MPHCIETCMTTVNNDIRESGTKRLPKDNLTKEERNALKSLEERTDILIAKANERGVVTIWDTITTT